MKFLNAFFVLYAEPSAIVIFVLGKKSRTALIASTCVDANWIVSETQFGFMTMCFLFFIFF